MIWWIVSAGGAKCCFSRVKGVSSSWQRISLTPPSIADRLGASRLARVRQTLYSPGSSASADPVPITPMKLKIVGPALPNIPWEAKPAGNPDTVWRYSANPVVGRRPLPRVTGIYNSAVVPWKDGFIGVFRTEGMDRIPHLHVGRSKDGFKFTFEPKPIELKCEDPEVRRFEAPTTREVTLIEHDVYYVTWCNGYHGPTIGIARTKDFVHFEQLENAFLPYNRNGVLFPRKFGKNFLMLSRPSDTGHTPFGDIFISESPDMVYWGKHRHVIEQGRPVVAGHQDRRGPVADREPNEGGSSSTTARRRPATDSCILSARCSSTATSRGRSSPARGSRLIVPRGALRGGRVCPRRLLPGNWAASAHAPTLARSRSTTAPPTPTPRSASATRRRSSSSSRKTRSRPSPPAPRWPTRTCLPVGLPARLAP